ncbi:hypothetical protein TRFO_18544 [Tritrichomonas foetus]|uniref:Nucleotide-diphospho-sugar transferase domain-containing protein n=1 Tax=Tritrichomonas foetus TaxID=1144522 RepID=A0A1J4KQW6_9EUKA|nr:hypothetical protein TRFO_18544 [Tritrichomonas foetus]|eukprot:OHT11861.1 hypothetical protein TRFO_18544 [Tritrichomonas foetus]
MKKKQKYLIRSILIIHIMHALILFGLSYTWVFDDYPLPDYFIFQTLSYSKAWFVQSLPDFNTSDQKCPICNFPVRNYRENSQKNDMLMTVLLSNYIGLMPLARSIRATQTKARVIIFIDTTVKYMLNDFENSILSNCRIDLIDVGDIEQYPHYAYCFIRFYIYYDFLFFLTESEVNRIILFDGQDVIFQGDPFYEEFTKDQLIFTVEDRIINQTGWALRSYHKYFKKIGANIKDYYLPMINAGITLGGRFTIMSFIEAFDQRFGILELHEQVKKMEYVDQAIVHAMIYDKDLEDYYGINVTFSTIYDSYASISFGCWGAGCARKRPNNYSLGYYHMKNESRYQFIIHQYNRFPQFTESIYLACPIVGNESKINYMKGTELDENGKLIIPTAKKKKVGQPPGQRGAQQPPGQKRVQQPPGQKRVQQTENPIKKKKVEQPQQHPDQKEVKQPPDQKGIQQTENPMKKKKVEQPQQ